MNYYYVYILTNKTHTIFFAGITHQLTEKLKNGHYKLVYFEVYKDFDQALKRAKELKSEPKLKRLSVVLKSNPHFESLPEEISL